MYTLLVCADLYGEKINLELTFAAMPTIGELQRKVGEVFNFEAQAKRPQGYPNIEFTCARLQIYDDVLLKWADLVTCTQLHEYDQLYAFQPQSPWHIDVQKDLPPPRPPTSTATRAPPQAPMTPGAGYADTPASQQHYAAHQQSHHQPQGQSPYPAAHHQHHQQHGASPATPYNVSAIGGGATGNRSGHGGQNRSPVFDKIEQNRSREEQLRAELARIADENARLEREAQAEREEQQRREAQSKDHELREREAEIQRQREALRAMEEEYQRAAGGRR